MVSNVGRWFGCIGGVVLLKRSCVIKLRNFSYDVKYEINVLGFLVSVFRWGFIYSFYILFFLLVSRYVMSLLSGSMVFRSFRIWVACCRRIVCFLSLVVGLVRYW